MCQKSKYDSDQGELAHPSAAAAATSRTIAPTSSVWMKVCMGARTALTR